MYMETALLAQRRRAKDADDRDLGEIAVVQFSWRLHNIVDLIDLHANDGVRVRHGVYGIMVMIVTVKG